MPRCHTLPSEHDDTAFTQLMIFLFLPNRLLCNAEFKTIALYIKLLHKYFGLVYGDMCNGIGVIREM